MQATQKDPLYGKTLQKILEELQETYRWEGLAWITLNLRGAAKKDLNFSSKEWG